MSTIIWFQRDLRIQCNPALHTAIQHATNNQQALIAIYIHSPDEDKPWSNGSASKWWLHYSLIALKAQLKKLAIELQLYSGNSTELLPQLAKLYRAKTVIWSERYEPQRRDCEDKIDSELTRLGIPAKRIKNPLQPNPEQFLTRSQQTPYRVFTPFSKRLRQQLEQKLQTCHDLDIGQTALRIGNLPSIPQDANEQLLLKKPALKQLSVEQLQLLSPYPWHQKLHQYWIPGENQAQHQLHNFLNNHLNRYSQARDIPGLDATSRLSPHLHYGEISTVQLLEALFKELNFNPNCNLEAAEHFVRQIVWREFAQYILYHYPHTSDMSMDCRFRDSFWQQHPKQLRQWQRGKTGIPIIDAGMRQLWETGWMHNRVRMLCASLLTKNLGISWMEGARWFWDTLVDADLANNSLGWQWVAGCGVDAAPYFRIFNPILQQQRFDQQLLYLNRWLQKPLMKGNIEPTGSYIVDLKQSREQALQRYRLLD